MSEVKNSPAMTRIENLLDENSFVELGALVTSRTTDFNLNKQATPSDGVVVGHGLIDGNLVFVYSQDASVLGGSIGEMHAKKILNVYEMAVKMGAPIIGIIDSTGVRLQESVDALENIGLIYAEAVKASGIVPQITAVFGQCGGGLSVLPAIADFSFMTNDGKLFINSPDTIDGNNTDICDSSSADFQFENTGIIDAIGSDDDVMDKIRQLVTLLPCCNLSEGCIDDEVLDDLNRASDVETVKADPIAFAKEISDNHILFEAKAGFAKEMATAFIKLDGITVGLVGNASENGLLTADGCKKAADFVRFCDAFEIPVLSITNAKGYQASIDSEKAMPHELSRLAFAFAEATVPKINVITEEAFGSAYVLMNSKSLGADLVFAYPDSNMGIMDSTLAAKIISDGTDLDVNATASEFEEKSSGIMNAARRGYVDRIMNYADTRKYLISSFEMLLTKSVNEAYKKHGSR